MDGNAVKAPLLTTDRLSSNLSQSVSPVKAIVSAAPTTCSVPLRGNPDPLICPGFRIAYALRAWPE